jgi:ABC-type microcin C transport system permease subunit YejB
MAFAIGQSVGGYSLAWLYGVTHDYPLLFMAGFVVTLLGLAIELVSGRSDRSD